MPFSLSSTSNEFDCKAIANIDKDKKPAQGAAAAQPAAKAQNNNAVVAAIAAAAREKKL